MEIKKEYIVPESMEKVMTLGEFNKVGVKEKHEEGRDVVGMYCMYSPQEIPLAAGAVTVSLCGTSNDPVEEGEKTLPRNLCPLIKSSLGFAKLDTCPYFFFSDVIIGETTCDGKKKMYEEMAEMKPMMIMDLPNSNDKERDLEYWLESCYELKDWLEEKLNVEITDEGLSEAIKLMNRERDVFRRLHEVNMKRPAVLPGLDMLYAQWFKGFNIDKEYGMKLTENLIEECEQRRKDGIFCVSKDAPRILITGTPMGMGSEKVVRILEELGASVVALENCTGYKPLYIDVVDKGNPMRAIAEKYLHTPCSVMVDNTQRFKLIKELAENYDVDGIVDLTWQACHTYNIESYPLKQFIDEHIKIPYLQIETDYSDTDIGQLTTRIEAFLETIDVHIGL